MRKSKLACTGLTLGLLTLNALFADKPTSVQASANTCTASPGNTFKVVVQMTFMAEL